MGIVVKVTHNITLSHHYESSEFGRYYGKALLD
jgi:hypothetical protein